MGEEIERMVSEAEKYKAEDDANRNRIESKNALENYCYSLKGSIGGDEVAAKMDPDDKAALESKIEETISWLNSNPAAEKEEYKEKQKELEGVATPILQKWAELVVCQEECRVVCLTWAVCQGLEVLHLQLIQQEDRQSKKSIKILY